MSEGMRYTYGVLAAVMLGVHFLARPLLEGLVVTPDLLSGGILVAGLTARAGTSAILGFLAGLLEAALSMGGLGRLTFVYTLLGYGSARSRDLIFADLEYFLFAYLSVGTWLTQVVLALLAGSTLSWSFVFVMAPINALLTALVGEIGARVGVALGG